jgi:hypothetical protein
MSRETPLFAPLDLSPYANAGRVSPPGRWRPAFDAALAGLATGRPRYWGIPFEIAGAPAGDAPATDRPCWLLLGRGDGLSPEATLAWEGPAAPGHVVFLHLCGFASGASQPEDLAPSLSLAGQEVAGYVLVYADGTEHRQPLRWRFEINAPGPPWGQKAFAARSHVMDAAVEFQGPYTDVAWGRAQTSVEQSHGQYWLYALANPYPERALRAIRLEATGEAAIAVGAVTGFLGRDHPLRHRRLQSFRVTLPEETRDAGAVEAALDLGVIARKYAVPAFDPDAWLSGEGISQPLPRAVPAEVLREIVLDVTASADATLTVAGRDVPLRPAYEQGASRSADGAVRVEVLTPRNTWLHVTVSDGDAGRPVPSRVHFRAPDGRYLPPYGFRQDVNDNWFEDYGNDLKLHGTQYAYVDGAFQAELPVGDVYAEVFKGFEHRPLRQRLTIAPGQRALSLRLERPLDWAARGWVTADTHVHFISPQTAWLQGQAEGLNLINLLASQWGDLYTNVGDISGGLSGVSRDGTLIYVGTENRQHLLGHISLLGIKGEPVFPMTTSGPSESYLGDPTWTTLAEWADEARRKDGVVVIPHFPNPYCEVAADIVLGKIDAVEINMSDFAMQIGEWYRYLNCGYRVAAVGGTDKMGAYMPVGAIRTYARLEGGPGAPLTFESWAGAVRAGRTFTTTGPLVDLLVEGHSPGDEVRLPSGGGTLQVEARAESVVPFHLLEVVVNGEVVAAEQAEAGTNACTVRVPVRVPGSGWIAARCTSRLDRWIGSPRPIAAHTSPVYVVAGEEDLFNPSDATYMLTLLEGGLTWLDTLSIPADPDRQRRARQVFEDAQGALHRRMHARGEAHGHDGAGHHRPS